MGTDRARLRRGASPSMIDDTSALADDLGRCEDAKKLVENVKPTADSSKEGSVQPNAAEDHRGIVREKWATLRNTLKASGLNSLYRLIELGLPGGPDQPRVAIFKDRIVALLACALHIPPLVATGVMGWYIFHGYWFGGHITAYGDRDTRARLGLLFAAKFLEINIVASLATMIFTFARYEATKGRGAPLASFFTGTDFQSPGFLWSEGLLALVAGKFSSIGRKLFFILFSVLCCLLAITVSPATASILLPIEDWYVLGGTRMFLNTTSHPYTRAINVEDSTPGEETCQILGRAYCPSDGWELARELVSPLLSDDDSTTHLGRAASRNIANLKGYGFSLATSTAVCRPRASYMSPNPRNVSVISIPHHSKAAAFHQTSALWSRAMDIASAKAVYRPGTSHRITTRAEQIAVETICYRQRQFAVAMGEDIDQESQEMMFPDVRGRGHDARNVSFPIEVPALGAFISQHNESRSDLHFFDVPEELEGVASLGAVVMLPRRGDDPSVILGCLLNAQWHKTSFDYNTDKHEVFSPQAPNDHMWGEDKAISVSASFGNLTNLAIEDPVEGGESSIFEAMVRASSAGTLLGVVASNPGSTIIPCVVETILNAMIGNGLARTSPQIGPFLDVKEEDSWWRSFFPPRGQTFDFEPGQTIFDVNEESFSLADFQWENFGYAYSSRDTTVRYAMLGLFFYSFITLSYISWSVAVGVTSSTWQSTPEIMALAMRSPPPGNDKMPTSILHGTQALKQTYCLVAEGDEIRLQPLPGGGKVPVERRVHVNTSYM